MGANLECVPKGTDEWMAEALEQFKFTLNKQIEYNNV